MDDLPWPFVGAEALSKSRIPERAMRNSYAQLYPGVFIPRSIEPTARQRAEAAWLRSKRRGVVAGLSAAAMLGTRWIDSHLPAELIHDNRKSPAGLVVRTETLAPGEVIRIGAMNVTTAARTAFDLGRHTAVRLKAVQRLDALANATGVKPVDVEAVIAQHPGMRGVRRLRSVLPFIDGGAESPQETVARLALIDAGLPWPRTQFEVVDDYGLLIARVDMAYDEVKVGIEYDGPQHWEDPLVRQRDIDKHVAFDEMGWHVIRVSKVLLWQRRATYVHRVETALRNRGMVW